MQVIIDGIEYAPKRRAAPGRTPSLNNLFSVARRKTGLTLAQIARKTGLSINVVHHAEYGTVKLRVALILAREYGIPLDDLERSVLREDTDHVPNPTRPSDRG
jgi:transcriptional regulator with XRE-family HTH domain